MNKFPAVVRATNGCLALPVTQSGRAEYRDIRPALPTCPGRQLGWGLFPFLAWAPMTSANSLSLILRRLDEIERKLDRILEELRTPAAIGYSARRGNRPSND
jgi:hypothetical protein